MDLAGRTVTLAPLEIRMTSAQVEKVFDKFYRVGATSTAISGIGLGMTIVKYPVDAHGSKVKIESTSEKEQELSCLSMCRSPVAVKNSSKSHCL